MLQALGGLRCGGAESRVMDITRRLDNTNIEYDFLLHDKGPDFYEDEASSLGANIYRVPAFRIINYFSYVKALNRLFQEHKEIDIVQGHITSSAAIYLPIAKKHGVKVTIAHGRSAGVDKGIKGILTRVLRKNLYKKCDLMRKKYIRSRLFFIFIGILFSLSLLPYHFFCDFFSLFSHFFSFFLQNFHIFCHHIPPMHPL